MMNHDAQVSWYARCEIYSGVIALPWEEDKDGLTVPADLQAALSPTDPTPPGPEPE